MVGLKYNRFITNHLGTYYNIKNLINILKMFNLLTLRLMDARAVLSKAYLNLAKSRETVEMKSDFLCIVNVKFSTQNL